MNSASFARQLENIEREQSLPCPPKWACDRVDEICGGAGLTDSMPNVVFLRLAEYVAAREARLLASVEGKR